jgi:hypothetical protein
MNKRIVYKQDDDTVAIVIPTASVESALKDVPKGKDHIVVDVEDIPSDRTYRNAWKLKGKKIVVDDTLKAKVQAELDKIANMPTIESLTAKLDELEKRVNNGGGK